MPRLEDFNHRQAARELIATNLAVFGDRRLPAAGQREAAVYLAQQNSNPELAVYLENIDLIKNAMAK